jgi:hypothetical protein
VADFDEIRVIMDLPRLGELIAHVAASFAAIREIDPPDFGGDEMRELAISGWRYCVHMNDRAEFARSVQSDLAALDAIPTEPQHRSEFGL